MPHRSTFQSPIMHSNFKLARVSLLLGVGFWSAITAGKVAAISASCTTWRLPLMSPQCSPTIRQVTQAGPERRPNVAAASDDDAAATAPKSASGPMRPLAASIGPASVRDFQAGLLAWRGLDSPSSGLRISIETIRKDSLQSDEARALLHHLDRHAPAGTRARNRHLARRHHGDHGARAVGDGQGHVDTIDPFGGERCPPIIASFPPELRELMTFRAENSATYFDGR